MRNFHSLNSLRIAFFFILLLGILSPWNSGKGQTGYVWCKTIQSPGWNDSGMDVDCDVTGRVFIAGDYDNNALFGGVPEPSMGESDMYTCRLDAFGNFEWVHTEGFTGIDRTFGVRVGEDAHVYATGYGLVMFPGHRVAMHAWDAITMRLRPDGALHWGWAMEGGGASDYSEGRDIASDAHGNSYTVGLMKNDGWYGMDTVYGLGSEDAFVVKFDSVGDYVWGQAWGGPSNDRAYGVDVDAQENIWVGGSFRDNADFGGIPLASAGQTDAFIAKMAPNGNVLFAKRFFGNGKAEVVRLKVSADGDCYFAGNFDETLTVGSQVLTAVDTLDIFYGKMDAAGNILWARQAGGVDMDFAQDLEIDAEENIYIGGFFFGELGWQTDTVVSMAYDDMYFAKTDSNGVLILLEASHDPSSRDIFGLAVDPAQNIIVTGLFSDTLTLGPPTHNSTLGTFDIFIAKYATRVQALAIVDVQGTPYCSSDQFQVTFQAWGNFDSGNVFYLELSDANGNFASPQVIGSLNSSFGGSITGTIPVGIVSGTGYRMRIRSTSPVAVSPDNGYDITLYPTTAVPVEILGDTVLCNGMPVVLSVNPSFSQQTWSTGDTTATITVSQPGVVWVEATDSNGCSNQVQVNVVLCVGMTSSETGRQLTLYPNPVTEGQRIHLHARGFTPGMYQLMVVDGRGGTVFTKEVPLGSPNAVIAIDLPELASGIYLLRLRGQSGSAQLRFLRQ